MSYIRKDRMIAQEKRLQREADKAAYLDCAFDAIATAQYDPACHDVMTLMGEPSEHRVRIAIFKLLDAGRVILDRTWRHGQRGLYLVNVYRPTGTGPRPEPVSQELMKNKSLGLYAKDHEEVEDMIRIERKKKQDRGESGVGRDNMRHEWSIPRSQARWDK